MNIVTEKELKALSKDTLITLLRGTPVCFKLVYAKHPAQEYCGNQWNESWQWKSSFISSMSKTELEELILKNQECLIKQGFYDEDLVTTKDKEQ